MSKNQQKKILYLGGFELPDKNAAAHRVIANGYILSDIGYDVTLLGLSKVMEGKNIEDTKFKYNNFTCYEYPYPVKISDWISYLTSIKHIKTFITKNNYHFDTIIAYNYPGYSLNLLYKFCKKNNITLYSDCTEWYSANSGSLVFRALKWTDTYLRMNIVHKKMKNIISISTFLDDYYKAANCNSIKVPPLVNTNEEKWKFLEKYHPNKNRNFFYAGNPGKSGEKDNIGIVIDAFYELFKKGNRFKITFAGFTKEEFSTHYPNYSEVLKDLEKHISFLGRISHKEVLNNLNKSDFSIFFRPNNRVTKAGFPTKFVESITAGTPVITNDISDISDFLIEGKNGFLISENTKENLMKSLLKGIELTDSELLSINDYCQNNNAFFYKNYIPLFKGVFI